MITIRYVRAKDVARWEKQESKGTLGRGCAWLLSEWRRLAESTDGMISMVIQDGIAKVAAYEHTVPAWDIEIGEAS